MTCTQILLRFEESSQLRRMAPPHRSWRGLGQKWVYIGVFVEIMEKHMETTI